MSTILAIDLGKYNFVFCWCDESSGEVSFRTAKTTPAVMQHELTRQAVSRVVIEACAPAGWVHDLCCEVGLWCEVANTAGAAGAWKNVKRKTDRNIALKLAWLMPPSWPRRSAMASVAASPRTSSPLRKRPWN